MARMGGLDKAQASAPGAGTNSDPIRNRDSGSLPHQPCKTGEVIASDHAVHLQNSRPRLPCLSSGICKCTRPQNQHRCHPGSKAHFQPHARGQSHTGHRLCALTLQSGPGQKTDHWRNARQATEPVPPVRPCLGKIFFDCSFVDDAVIPVGAISTRHSAGSRPCIRI